MSTIHAHITYANYHSCSVPMTLEAARKTIARWIEYGNGDGAYLMECNARICGLPKF